DRNTKLAELRLDKLEPADLKTTGAEAVEAIFNDAGGDKLLAARKTLTLLEKDRDGYEPLMKGARRLIFTKGNDSHDYKYSSATLEDYFHVYPRYRSVSLAMSLFQLRNAKHPDNDLIKRARAALAKS